MFFEQSAQDKNRENFIKKLTQLQSEVKRLHSEFESTGNNCRRYGGGMDDDLERILNDVYWEAKELYHTKKKNYVNFVSIIRNYQSILQILNQLHPVNPYVNGGKVKRIDNVLTKLITQY